MLAGEEKPKGVDCTEFDIGLDDVYGASIEALRGGSDSNDDGGVIDPYT